MSYARSAAIHGGFCQAVQPSRRQTDTATMQGAPKPIRSLLEHDPDLEDALEAFILKLGETVDDLQDAVMALDWPLLDGRTQAFLYDAERLGYPSLAGILGEVLVASGLADEEGARKAVADLTELAQRVRRGHHSAA